MLGEPVGKQDQYIAAFGGLTCFEFHADDRVTVSPLAIARRRCTTSRSDCCCSSPATRASAGAILEDQKHAVGATATRRCSRTSISTKALGGRIRDVLEGGSSRRTSAELMHEHWQRKRGRSAGMTNEQIDRWYAIGLANGAIGGKLVGAGTGGFLMFYATDPRALRAAIGAEGLQETRFAFDLDGSTVIVRH